MRFNFRAGDICGASVRSGPRRLGHPPLSARPGRASGRCGFADLDHRPADVGAGVTPVEGVDARLDALEDVLAVHKPALLLPLAERGEGLVEAAPLIERVEPLHERA